MLYRWNLLEDEADQNVVLTRRCFVLLQPGTARGLSSCKSLATVLEQGSYFLLFGHGHGVWAGAPTSSVDRFGASQASPHQTIETMTLLQT